MLYKYSKASLKPTEKRQIDIKRKTLFKQSVSCWVYLTVSGLQIKWQSYCVLNEYSNSVTEYTTVCSSKNFSVKSSVWG
jgi:hypothetical protein